VNSAAPSSVSRGAPSRPVGRAAGTSAQSPLRLRSLLLRIASRGGGADGTNTDVGGPLGRLPRLPFAQPRSKSMYGLIRLDRNHRPTAGRDPRTLRQARAVGGVHAGRCQERRGRREVAPHGGRCCPLDLLPHRQRARASSLLATGRNCAHARVTSLAATIAATAVDKAVGAAVLPSQLVNGQVQVGASGLDAAVHPGPGLLPAPCRPPAAGSGTHDAHDIARDPGRPARRRRAGSRAGRRLTAAAPRRGT
jgi:hypothetical protein